MSKLERISQKTIDEITLKAVENDWEFLKFDTNTGMISFHRNVERVNIYLTTLTVSTVINHPKKGRKQLHRKNLSIKQVYEILKNPRVHTGEGYYDRKK